MEISSKVISMKVYKFYSDTCSPCKVLTSMLKNSKYRDLIEDIDITKRVELLGKYEVKKVPTLVFVDENEEMLFRSVGVLTQIEFEKLVDELNLNNGSK